jgi:hypothetical protein
MGVEEWAAVSNAQLLELPGRQRPRTSYWIIADADHSQLRALTLDLSFGKQALATFSFQEEAELFLLLDHINESWQLRESSAGEVISLLMGPHVDVGHVALDPAPEMLAQKTGGLVSLKRERFLELILDRGR